MRIQHRGQEPEFASTLPDETPFPVFAAASWSGPRYLAFHASDGEGLLREVTLGHGVRWSDKPWFEVTSFAPSSHRNQPSELARIATHRLEGAVNDYNIRGLSLGEEPVPVSNGLPKGCLVLGEQCAFTNVVAHGSLVSAALIAPNGRGVVLTWRLGSGVDLPEIELISFIGSYETAA